MSTAISVGFLIQNVGTFLGCFNSNKNCEQDYSEEQRGGRGGEKQQIILYTFLGCLVT